MPNRIRAVLLDRDSTLVARDSAFQAWTGLGGLGRHSPRGNHFHAVDATTIERVVTEVTTFYWCGRAAKDVVVRTLKERYQELVVFVDWVVADFHERMIVYLPPLDPGTAQLLDALDGANLPWGIGTNGSQA